MTRDDLDRMRTLVSDLVSHGARLRELERDLIERMPVDRDRRDALWLYAWCCRESRGQNDFSYLAYCHS